MRKRFNELFFPHDRKTEHVKALDGLRGIAVLLVLLSHTSNANIFIHEWLNFQGVGKVGVYLFFVLSAYLLDRQIALAFMTGKSSTQYWKNYALRRFLRIYPLFVVALILHGLLTLLGVETVINKLLDIPLHMLLVRGESIFWSIPVEFKYYLISPFLMWFCFRVLKWNKIRLMVIFMALIAAAISLELIFKLPIVSTLRYLPIFLVGTIISIYEIIGKQEMIKGRKPIYFDLMGLFAGLFILISVPFFFEYLIGLQVDFHSSVFYLPYAILWGVILLAGKYGRGMIKAILELKFLRFIGSISFSVYLFHKLFLNLVEETSFHPQMKMLIFFFLTIIFSSITFLLVERPLSKIRIYSKEITEKEIPAQTTTG
jgi:peptidoglycan/LPS O-acetylase OafA/YrhL